MDKRIIGVAAIGGIGILAYFLLSKGTVPMLGGTSDPGTGYTPQDYQDILYALPAEPAVSFPALPTFQDIFPQERVGDIGSSKKTSSIFSGPSYYGSVPMAQVGSSPTGTSSSNVLSTAKKEAGGILLTTMLAGLFGPAGVVVGGLGNLAKDTPIGQSVTNTLSGIMSLDKKSSPVSATAPSTSMGGFGSSGYRYTSATGREVITSSVISPSRSSGSSLQYALPGQQGISSKKPFTTVASSSSIFGGGGVGGR